MVNSDDVQENKNKQNKDIERTEVEKNSKSRTSINDKQQLTRAEAQFANQLAPPRSVVQQQPDQDGVCRLQPGSWEPGRALDVSNIIQMDGNDSIDVLDTNEDVGDEPSQNENDNETQLQSKNPRVRNSKTMPVIAVANARSLQPKLKSTIEKIENEEIDILFVNEVWEKTGKKNKHFQGKVEEMTELHGLKYISSGARPSGKRGGGTGIITNLRKFSLDKLDVHVPHNLEVKWGIVRPKESQRGGIYKEVLVCSFYSPPSSKKNKKLTDHLVTTTHALLAKYPDAAVILAGDKNDLPLSPLLQCLPKFVQIVNQPTHGNKIIDVIIMNCAQMYGVPQISPPVLPDDPEHAAPSDHHVPIVRPLAHSSDQVCNTYVEKRYRPLPESGKREFLEWIHLEKWKEVAEDVSPTQQVEQFTQIVDAKVNSIFPEKTVKIRQGKDKEFITAELKKLDRKKKKEWRKNGRSEKYRRIKSEFDAKYKKAAAEFLRKCVDDMKTENPSKAAATLKKMAAMPGDSDDGTFTLLNHIAENLTVEQQIERISDFFIAVSQEFPPLTMDQLSPVTLQKLKDIQMSDIPNVEEYEIYQILKTAKKRKSSVPGDMPPELFYEASAGLARPAAKIMNNIAKTGEWPKQFQTEWGVPVQKVSNAKDESEIRLISCTNKMNLILEKQVVRWLMKYVDKRLDPDQFGGKKGHSISHYLIEMTNFILYNQDLREPHATIANFIDFKQGFNRCQHSIFIEILSQEFDIPGWLIRILIGYLTQRKMKVRFKGKVGEEKGIPGGAGQGAPLGMWVFLFMIDRAGPKPNQIPLGEIITKPEKKRQNIQEGKQKFVDDFTVLTSLNLKKTLVEDTNPGRELPVPFRSRTGHVLPSQANPLQEHMNQIIALSRERKMVLNPIKTKTMIFNTQNNYDVLPIISTGNTAELDVVEEHKILGQIIRSDLKTISNTENICKKAFKRMWILRRLKALGASNKQLIEVMKQQIISICEVGVPYWGPMITARESNMLERCMKTGLHIIFQENYQSYEHALKQANLKTLRQRRILLMNNFAKKASKSERFNKWFVVESNEEGKSTRTKKPTRLLRQIPCRTQRYERSSLPYMTKLLSWHPPLPAPDLSMK